MTTKEIYTSVYKTTVIMVGYLFYVILREVYLDWRFHLRLYTYKRGIK